MIFVVTSHVKLSCKITTWEKINTVSSYSLSSAQYDGAHAMFNCISIQHIC
jgi:hypothetical protein